MQTHLSLLSWKQLPRQIINTFASLNIYIYIYIGFLIFYDLKLINFIDIIKMNKQYIFVCIYVYTNIIQKDFIDYHFLNFD